MGGHNAKVFAKALLIVLLAGCAHTPKQTFIVAHDPVMDQNGGVVLIADVCLQKDVVGDGDYFSIAESKEGAKALLASARTYLREKQVSVRTELVPFVCGSLTHGNHVASFKVADRVGGETKQARPPFAVEPEIGEDPELLKALLTLSGEVYSRTAAQQPSNQAMQAKKGQPQPPPFTVGAQELAEATQVVAEKMNASSVLYLGVNGTSISTGKAVGQGLLSAAIGMATGVATGVATHGHVYVMFFPGYSVDWRNMSCGLLNLEAGQCTWSSSVSGPGDPMKPKVVAEPRLVAGMLYGLVHKPAPQPTAPEKQR